MMDSLTKALKYFDGESGLDNLQVKYFLKKAFVSGNLNKKDIIRDLFLKFNDQEFNWRKFANDLNLMNSVEELSQEEVKEYVLDLLCDHILSI